MCQHIAGHGDAGVSAEFGEAKIATHSLPAASSIRCPFHVAMHDAHGVGVLQGIGCVGHQFGDATVMVAGFGFARFGGEGSDC